MFDENNNVQYPEKLIEKLVAYENTGYEPDDIYNLSNNQNFNIPKGSWLINPDGYYPYCSRCKEEPKSGELSKFCPNCGADMKRDNK